VQRNVADAVKSVELTGLVCHDHFVQDFTTGLRGGELSWL
jgi:hypothetical protein